ncbi:phage virion morphogenesis protein [Idiomarina xiamenensis]|uniref:Phage virion morphogenesis protein n=1 Tax=Idiomarina xiamenensis 10-D-4 TaxID=740709 RepID=K2JW55_9GAMM|nr:phage virion morphogenesis protein [Idiomarina xiamenensis]EKE79718.1 hypothetical protein A10D4_12699 [Idiomarina xiamenensis 10-D-4]
MVMSVNLNEQEFSRIKRSLDEVGSDQRREFFKRVGQGLRADFQMGFRQGKAPDGTPWKPVKRAGQPLRDTGRLQQSIRARFSAKSAEVGTNVEYGPPLQDGTGKTVNIRTHTRIINKAFGRQLPFPVAQTVGSHKRKMNLPARPFLGIHAQQERKIVQIFNQYMSTIDGVEPSGLA